jgi:GTP-binding protein HflX
LSDRAILVHIGFQNKADSDDLNEFTELVISAGAVPVLTITGTRPSPDSKTFVGKGKLAEILEQISLHEATVVIFNHVLTASQERNLQKALTCHIVDRTELILGIFAMRARTHEGKLQVELAQLQHQSTRLVRGWTHLERQRGGIGLRSGMGESQLEIDRRLLRGKIKAINKALEAVRNQRAQSRRARQKSTIATVAIVGYTNAGKSTLFNSLTHEHIYVADQLFATLDPTLRQLKIPGYGKIVLADTVGFIRQLPHDLIDSFRATLEETRDADLLLHVVDASRLEKYELIQHVNAVLEEIGAGDVPQMLVFNKIDLLEQVKPHLDQDIDDQYRVWISANTGAGIPDLYQGIAALLSDNIITCCVALLPEEGKIRAELYELGAIVEETRCENGVARLEIRLQLRDFLKLFK